MRLSVIAFADARTDARTLNVCRTLAEHHELTLWNLEQAPAATTWQWNTITCPQTRRMLWQWLAFIIGLLRRAWSQRVDVVWAADVYALLPAVVLAWRWRARVVYDSREVYSALSTLSHRPFAQRILAIYERTLVRRVDRVVVSGERDAQVLSTLLPLRAEPLVLLNVPFYAEPQQTDRLRQHCNISAHEQVLLYQGALLPGRGLARAIEVLAHLPVLHFCVLGSGPFSSQLQQHAKEFGVAERVHLLGAVPYEELLEWTASADIGWCVIEPISRSYELALPNKLFEYAMARVPVVASALPALREILQTYPFGELVAADAPTDELVAAIVRILKNPVPYRSHAERAARVFCYERQQPLLRQLVAELGTSAP